jgi:ribosomal protein S4
MSIRGRRLHRGGLFRRYVLVFTSIKWTEARRQFRPFTRRTGYSRAGGGTTALGRPRKRRYRESFYIKQQLRTFHGKRSEQAFRSLARRYQIGIASATGDNTRSFAAILSSRLDVTLFRIRFRPTIYACHQFIRHQGLAVNGQLSFAPQSKLRVGDTISLVPIAGSIANQYEGASRLQR